MKCAFLYVPIINQEIQYDNFNIRLSCLQEINEVGKKEFFISLLCNKISPPREAERNRKKEYDSAVRIQSWVRGIKVRAYLK